jgi:hypothetical protein
MRKGLLNEKKIRESMKTAGFPVPAELVARLAQLSPEDINEVLLDHPGFAAWKQYGSYRIRSYTHKG